MPNFIVPAEFVETFCKNITLLTVEQFSQRNGNDSVFMYNLVEKEWHCTWLENIRGSFSVVSHGMATIRRDLYNEYVASGKITVEKKEQKYASDYTSREQKSKLNYLYRDYELGEKDDKNEFNEIKKMNKLAAYNFSVLSTYEDIQQLAVDQFWERGLHIVTCQAPLPMQFYSSIVAEISKKQLSILNEKELLVLWMCEDFVEKNKVKLTNALKPNDPLKEKLFTLLEIQANKNDPDGHAAAWLGMLYLKHKKNKVSAFKSFAQAAEKDHPDACYFIAVGMDEGWVKKEEPEQVFAYFKHAAKMGSPEAYRRLAMLYKEGKGCKKDERLSDEAEARAAGYGYLDALKSQCQKALKEKSYIDVIGCHNILQLADPDWLQSELYSKSDEMNRCPVILDLPDDIENLKPVTVLGYALRLCDSPKQQGINVLEHSDFNLIETFMRYAAEKGVAVASFVCADHLLPPLNTPENLAKKMTFLRASFVNLPLAVMLEAYHHAFVALNAKNKIEEKNKTSILASVSIAAKGVVIMREIMSSVEMDSLKKRASDSKKLTAENIDARLRLAKSLAVERIFQVNEDQKNKVTSKRDSGVEDLLLPVWRSKDATKSQRAEAGYCLVAAEFAYSSGNLSQDYLNMLEDSALSGNDFAKFACAKSIIDRERCGILLDDKQRQILKAIGHLKVAAANKHLAALKEMINYHGKGALFTLNLPKKLQDIDAEKEKEYKKQFEHEVNTQARQWAERAHVFYKKALEQHRQGRNARDLFKQAADYFHPDAQFYVGLYAFQEGNHELAKKVFQMGAENGHVHSIYGLGGLYYLKDKTSHYAKECFLIAAESGFPPACQRLADIEKRAGNLNKAAEWEKKAFEMAMPDEFREKNHQKGLIQCRALIDKVTIDSSSPLATVIAEIKKDLHSNDKKRHKKAIDAVKSLFTQGERWHPGVQRLLSICYEFGVGVQQSDVLAKMHAAGSFNQITLSKQHHSSEMIERVIKPAADNRDPLAQYCLYLYYEKRDPRRAKQYLLKAYHAGLPLKDILTSKGWLKENEQKNGDNVSSTKSTSASILFLTSKESTEQKSEKSNENNAEQKLEKKLEKKIEPTIVELGRLAEQGKASTQYMQALSYEKQRKDELAFKFYKLAANKQLLEAMLKVADSYLRGKGVKQSTLDAVEWYEKSVNEGSAAALNELGKLFLTGRKDFKADPKKAFQYFEQAVQAGFNDARVGLARCYQSGLGVEKNQEKFLEQCRLAAEARDPEAQYLLGNYAWAEGEKENAMKWWSLSAQLGFAMARKALRKHDQENSEVEEEKNSERESKEDVREDINVFLPLPDMQHAFFQPFQVAALGLQSYHTGCQLFYARTNDIQAFACFMQAVQCGYLPAMHMVAECFFLGRGCVKDLEQAKHWYRISASHGNIHSMLWLSESFNLDKNIETREGHDWLRKAAMSGSAMAQFRLACLLFHSKNSTLQIEGYRWFLRASMQGYQAATAFISEHYSNEFIQKLDIVAFYTAEVKECDLYASTELAFHLIRVDQSEHKEEELEKHIEHADIKFRLAIMYLQSNEKQKQKEAIELLESAVNSKHILACNKLAECYRAGTGVEKSHVDAFKYFIRGANLGDAEAQYEVGCYFESGVVNAVQPNTEQAKLYYQKSADQGYHKAKEKLNPPLILNKPLSLATNENVFFGNKNVSNTDPDLGSLKVECKR